MEKYTKEEALTASSFDYLEFLPNVIQGVQHRPILRKRTHQVPVAHTLKAIFRDQGQFGPYTAGILEPHLVLSPLLVVVAEKRGLGGLVILDFRSVPAGYFHGADVGDQSGFGFSLDEREGPVVTVVGHAEENFFGVDFGDGVIQHFPHFVDGAYGHGGC